MNSILIIAAHPDDEVLGMGATIKKLSRKNKIHLCVVTEGASAQYKNKKMIKERKDACKKSAKILGISDISFLEFPDMKLDTVPHLTINRSVEKIISKIKPNVVYTTPYHDLNKDHRIVYESTLVASRALSSSVTNLFSYELPGFSKEVFTPNVYVDISDFIKYKIKAFEMYKSEIREFPHSRSIESIQTLSKFRGIESGLQNAESFKLIKSIS